MDIIYHKNINSRYIHIRIIQTMMLKRYVEQYYNIETRHIQFFFSSVMSVIIA